MDSPHDAPARRKLVSTSGLILTLLLLFLPFIGVSCESGMGSVNAEISGWDMVVGGEPSVSTSGLFSIGTPSDAEIDSAPVQALMILTVVASLGATLLAWTLRTAFAQALGTAVTWAVAALLVISNQVKVTNDMIDAVARDMDGTSELAADWVGSRVGFWLTLGLLLIMAAYHFAAAAASRRSGLPRAGSRPSSLDYPP